MMLRFVHDRPIRVYWEITRACDLACRHCRAEAVPHPGSNELTTAEGCALLERVAAFGQPLPHVILTGGDPLKRDDIFELIAIARGLGLCVSVAPSATPLLTRDALRRLHAAGVAAISLSLDGSTAARHDAIRGITGTYQRTLDAADVARQIGLPFQINTLVCTETADDLPAIHDQVVALGAARWSLFFLVSVGRGRLLQPVSAESTERLLSWAAGLSARSTKGELVISTTEAPQLRRIVLQRRKTPAEYARHAAGIRDGNGVLFISHTGDIYPSGFLEIVAGNVRRDDVVGIYRTVELFRQLRDADGFGGRCGCCEYRWLCGGSRARAFAASGDPLGEDPLCVYEPRRSIHFATSKTGMTVNANVTTINQSPRLKLNVANGSCSHGT